MTGLGPKLPIWVLRERPQRVLLPVSVLIAVTILWEVLVRLNPAPFHVIPAPSEVLEAIVRTQDVLFSRHIPQTMLETLIGLVIALILGVGLAALLDFSPTLKNAVYPLL